MEFFQLEPARPWLAATLSNRERARDVILSSRFRSRHPYSEIRMGDVQSLFTIRARKVLDDASRFLLRAPRLFTPAVTSDGIDHANVPVHTSIR